MQRYAVNVAKGWHRFAEGIRRGVPAGPDFEAAIARRRFIDAVQRASDTGQAQSL